MTTRALHRAATAGALVVTLAGAWLADEPAAQAEGQVSADNRALAETLFFAGRGLMEAKRYREACLKFFESYRLDPATGTLLNLAVCHEKEGKIASAWGEYKQALVESRKASYESRVQLAEQSIARLEPELPRLSIEVPAAAAVPGLEISRNGVPLQQGAWNTELPVDPGTVVVKASAPGRAPRELTIEIAPRETKRLEVPPLALVPRPTERVWSSQKKWGVASVVAGVAFVGLGATFGGLAVRSRRASDDACPAFDGEPRCDQAGADAMSRANRYAWASNVSVAVGLVGVGVGSWLIWKGGDVEQPRAAWELRVGPTLGGAQWSLIGRF